MRRQLKVVVISDEFSRSQRVDLCDLLMGHEIECDDQGYIPLDGANEKSVVLALESRGIPRDEVSTVYVFLSLTGTTFAMFVNKCNGITCFAQGDLVTVTEEQVRQFKPNAVEFSNQQNIKVVLSVIDLIMR